jgi:hypothetical protein
MILDNVLAAIAITLPVFAYLARVMFYHSCFSEEQKDIWAVLMFRTMILTNIFSLGLGIVYIISKTC